MLVVRESDRPTGGSHVLMNTICSHRNAQICQIRIKILIHQNITPEFTKVEEQRGATKHSFQRAMTQPDPITVLRTP